LYDEAGQPAGAMVLAHDVSEQRAAGQVAEELRERLVQMVNHEFRTPLTALLGHLELVREHRDEVTPELRRSLEAIERAGWRLSDLVCTVAQLIEREEELHRAGRTADGAPLRPVAGPDHGAARASGW
jgi:signal transduction histidine kinase